MSNTWEESSSLKILSSQIIEISDAVAIRPWRVSTTLKGGHFITSSLFPILSVSSMLIVCQSLNTNRMVASRKVCLHRLICQTSANCPIPFISDTSLFLHLDERQSWLYMNTLLWNITWVDLKTSTFILSAFYLCNLCQWKYHWSMVIFLL